MNLLFDNCILAVLIAGGYGLDTAELFLPSDGTSCTLPPLPQDRYDHTVDNHILCGGGATSGDSCLTWSPDTGTWEDLLTMDMGRGNHVSWTPANGTGTYLMGGSASAVGMTTTLITSEGGEETGFQLKYETK